MTLDAGCYVFTYTAPNGRTWVNTGSSWSNHGFCVTAGETATNLNAILN